LKRGEIWIVAGGKDYAGKPRPAVIVQDDRFDATDSITICVITSDKSEAPLFRIVIQPSDQNGLTIISRLMVDKITTIPLGIFKEEIVEGKDKYLLKKMNNWDSSKIHLIFHGSLPHGPNSRAITLLKNEIAPAFLNSYPNVEFKVAGNNVPKFKGKNIELMGFVDDITNFLDAADIAVVPIDTGSGVRIKMFDYLKRGIPIVTTAFAMRGFEVKNNYHVLMSKDIDEKFIANVEKLIDNKDLRETLSRNGRDLIIKKHEWRILIKQYYNLLINLKDEKSRANQKTI